jgi:hypothetical protein
VGVGGTVNVVVDSGTATGERVQGTVLHYSGDVDLALVSVPVSPGRSLKMSMDELPRETQEVVAVGFPLGSVRSLSEGQTDPPVSLRPGAITALHLTREGETLYIEHNTNMQTGSSGGALVDDRGHVVGVNVAMLREDQTTKLAIPTVAVLNYLEHWEQQPIDPAEGRIPRKEAAIQRELALPIQKGQVRDLAWTPDGQAWVLDMTGSVSLVGDEGSWETLAVGTSNGAIAVDDLNGELYRVESEEGKVLRLREDEWQRVGSGSFMQVAASSGHLWALSTEGHVFMFKGEAWEDLGIGGMDEVVACGGQSMLLAGERVWGVDADGGLANDGQPLVTGLTQVTCHRERAYAIRADGSIVDVMSGVVMEDATDNVAIFATPQGVLAQKVSGELWYLGPSFRFQVRPPQ